MTLTLSQDFKPIGNRIPACFEAREGHGDAMKKNRFTEDQIAYALKQAELGMSVQEVCRKMAISDSTFYVIAPVQ